jgi:chemotaxis protein histidine kinase CheA
MIKLFEKSKPSKAVEPKAVPAAPVAPVADPRVALLEGQLAKSQELQSESAKQLAALKRQLDEAQDALQKERSLSGEWANKLSVQSTTHKREIDQLRVELDATRLDSQNAKKTASEKDEALNQMQAKLLAYNQQLKEATQLLQAAEAQLAKATADKAHSEEQLRKLLVAKDEALSKANIQMNYHSVSLASSSAELEKVKVELDKVKAELAGVQKAQQDTLQKLSLAEQQSQASKEAELTRKDLEHENLALKAQLEDARGQLDALIQDAESDNEMLLMQLTQHQEESTAYFEEKNKFKKLYEAYLARWQRLEKRMPNLIDFGALTVEAVDTVSAVPSVTWAVVDYAQAGVTLPDFSFATVLVDGNPGIAVVSGNGADLESIALVPSALGTDPKQLALYTRLSASTFRQLNAAVATLEQFEMTQWKSAELPAEFDLSFWRPFIKTLITQFKALPATLRYDKVKLKRELINPDYEHLWLEFHDLVFGMLSWKKLEVKLGAALIQPGAFSLYPKFEIPLIDGKTKPFESWFAESHDDSGPKLELRFALERQVFDMAVWSKLSDVDRAIILRLIYAFPDALKRLEEDKVSIHRPWKTWIDFSTSAIAVLDYLRANQKAEAQTKQEPSALPTTTTPALTDAGPARTEEKLPKLKPANNKVITVAAKSGAKPAAKKTTKK